jgi:outer membrane beta-barrel protein
LFAVQRAEAAAEAEAGAMNDLENIYSNEENQVAQPEQINKSNNQQEHTQRQDQAKGPDKSAAQINTVSDLAHLSSLNDIAIIQRRFLPKTSRFEGFVAGTAILNDPFFASFGANLRLAYYFQERYGVELIASKLSKSERQVTTDLREKRSVLTKSLVIPEQYLGADFKWVPVYGKMSWRNKSIVPFDLYFSLGGGMTSTNQGTSEPTLHIGTGQAFAINKSVAFRWDFSWNTFSSKSSTNTGASAGSSSIYNNLFINLGVSFFFPGATYR